MNRKQKIIISVTGIFIVMLILVGLTYAYFLTQITGNTKDKSISVTTADLRVVYGDGTQELLTSSTKLVPSSNAINTKDFTVTNTGDRTEYAVLIENVRVKVAGTENLTTFESNDFKYTLTCTKSDGSSCNGVRSQTILPMSDSILVTNEIDSEDTHTYEITLWYLETNKDQSNDMNKTLEARINIEDPNRINPYRAKTNSLAYNIINNAMTVTNTDINNKYAVYRSTPLTEPAKELSLEIESSLTPTPDDYTQASGINSYYFRGNVENNYVEFNNMCWRIVRIEGDGSVKITLAKEDLCSTLSDDDLGTAIIDGSYGAHILKNLDSWFNGKLSDNTTLRFTNDIKSKIKSSQVCVGDTSTGYNDNGEIIPIQYDEYGDMIGGVSYDNYLRIVTNKSASLECHPNGKTESSYQISSLTVDEVVFAGGKYDSENVGFYLAENANNSNIDGTTRWYTVSIASHYYVDSNYFVLDSSGSLFITDETAHIGIRPVISLIPGIELASDSGNGTKTNPYRVLEN